MTTDKKLTAHHQAIREVDFQIRSNRTLISICTHEEKRVLDAIRLVCRGDTKKDKRQWSLLLWDIDHGLTALSHHEELPPEAEQMDQEMVLSWFKNQESPVKDRFVVLVLKDFHKFLGEDGSGQVENHVVRQLRNIAQDSIGRQRSVILTGTKLFLPPELEKICAVIDWPLPEPEHIIEQIDALLSYGKSKKELSDRFKLDYDPLEMDDIVRAFQGLTLAEIELLCTYSMLTSNELDPLFISQKKRDIIRKSGLLDWIDVKDGMDSVGGLQSFKQWLHSRRGAFTSEAQAYGLPANPKGVLLVGIQGAGKSLASKATAYFWNLPLLRLDMGKVFQGIVGSSEENIRSVIKLAESVSPAILWIDEIEKGLSGVASSNQTDGGTASRVFGSILTWMQEKEAPIYIVATANDVSQLPPELLRKGRFDEIFCVDLPSDSERLDIFRIHLKKVNRNPDNFDLHALVASSQLFTGAEIEAAIISALYETFNDGKRELTTEDIIESITDTIPLATTMKERIQGLRDWAATRARSASQPQKARQLRMDKIAPALPSIQPVGAVDKDEDL